MQSKLSEIIQNKQLITDKNSLHSYCDHFYEKEFAALRDKPIQILEIGIDQGGSLILWAEYFSQSQILGVDLQLRGDCEKNISAYPNIKIALGNAYDFYSLNFYPQADIIIDDGPHDLDSQIWAVKHLSHRVKPGGLFIIEDVAQYEYLEKLKDATPFHLKDHVEFVDLRAIKNRSDDMMFVIRIPGGSRSTVLPVAQTIISTPTVSTPTISTMPGMHMMQERLNHLKNLLDFNSIQSIIDIGSAHGYESLNLATLFPNANVYGFEPLEEHFQHCLKVKTEAPIEVANRLHFSQLAVDKNNGTIKFYPIDPEKSRGNNTGMASKFQLIDPAVFPHELNIQKEISVSAVTLDSWCLANNVHPDIIWMDAQGAELDILHGAEHVLSHVKVILSEVGLKPYYHGHTLKKDIDPYLAKYGFKEIVSSRKLGHQYEIDTIYIKA